jgi:hypothetical protein
MALRRLLAAAMPAVLAVATAGSARAPAPLVPIALVEDVKSATAEVEFMDYVGRGQVIKLGPGDTLVLSYLKSCEHETIIGGTVLVGMERSEVKDGQVARAKVPCNGGRMQLSPQQASTSAATAFRLQSADSQPTLYARTPVVQLPRGLKGEDRTLRIERTDHRSERHEIRIDDKANVADFYDLAKTHIRLTPGATYIASIGSHEITFHIDRKAKSGPAPIVSRLLRFE